MTIWNPLVFTPTGQPVGAVAPPTLRVYGAMATAAQVAMAQTAFQNFTASARLSAAPNPTGIGALPDGSRFRIFVVGNQSIMELWTVGGVAPGTGVFSGILFRDHNIVLVNDGTVDVALKQWVIRDVTSVPTVPGYFNAAANQSLAPYNTGAIVAPSSIIPAPMRYMYRSAEIVARYGHSYANCMWPIGINAARDKFISLVYGVGGSQAWSIVYSFAVDVESLFKDFGAPLGSVPTVSLDYDSAVEMIAQSPGDPDVSIAGPYIRKDGAQVLFRKYVSSNAYTEADAGFLFRVKRIDRATASRSTVNGAITVPNTVVRMSFKNIDQTAVVFDRDGDSFGGPTVVHTVPQDDISAEGLYVGTWDGAQSAIVTSDDVGVHVDYKSGPSRVITDDYIDTEGDDPAHRGSEAIAGPISGRFTRIEKTYDCQPHFVAGEMVLLPRAKVTSHESECTGSVSYSYLDGYFDFESTHTGPHQPGQLTEAKEVHLLSSQSPSSSLHIDEYLTLNDGSRLYLVKYDYVESGTVDTEEHYLNNVIGEPAQRYGQDSKAFEYTVQREQRELLVYDPALDLLCYLECTFQATRSFSQLFVWESEPDTSSTYTNSGGGGLPAAPTPKLVIKCKSDEIQLDVPFNSGNFNLASLLPATGISPYADPNGDLLTSQGFPGWTIQESAAIPEFLLADTFLLDGENRSGDFNVAGVRGLAPRIVTRVPTVEYVKTPVTGGAYLRATLTVDGSPVLDQAYLIDGTGIRAVQTVFPAFNVDNEKGVPF